MKLKNEGCLAEACEEVASSSDVVCNVFVSSFFPSRRLDGSKMSSSLLSCPSVLLVLHSRVSHIHSTRSKLGRVIMHEFYKSLKYIRYSVVFAVPSRPRKISIRFEDFLAS